jgi:prolyl-tRNA synthetase
MLMSRMLIPTLREDPKEAEVISHKLMLRAGMIRKLAAGVYTFLPLGFRVFKKVEQIIREEMDRAGALEVLMPTLLPAELWQETGRWDVYGKELFRIKDRHDREFCLGPTHEEIITDLVRNTISSYNQLPVNLYQIQTKFRDEVRPRFGLMRGREFCMKDAYSFHATEECLETEYQNMYQTYCRIFDRIGLEYKVVEADSGAIGGGYSQEFMVIAESGEEPIYFCDSCAYCASRDAAGIGKFVVPEAAGIGELRQMGAKGDGIKKVKTPGQKTIEEVSSFLNISPQKMIKTLIYETEKGPVAALVRGDHALNEAKLKKVLGVENLRLAEEKDVVSLTGAALGFAGSVKLNDVKIVADHAVLLIDDGVTGANENDYHIVGVVYGRDYKADVVADIRFAGEHDACPRCAKGKLQLKRGIEVGHIFKLGQKYSEKMQARFSDEKNVERTFIMGCYGIGIGRTAAAAIEQKHDADGIIWPVSIAPYQVAVIPVNFEEAEQRSAAEKIYQELQSAGIEVVLDDRKSRIGMKLKDIDLIGFPIKIIVGPKGLKEGKVELKSRFSGAVQLVAIGEVLSNVRNLCGFVG